MQLGLGWIFVGAYAVENGRLSQIAVLGASSLYILVTLIPECSARKGEIGAKRGKYLSTPAKLRSQRRNTSACRAEGAARRVHARAARASQYE